MRTLHASCILAATIAMFVTPARGHVGLDAPNGGEVLEVGSNFTMEWHILIAHSLQNWDLWYSTTGSSGPWTTIAMDVPAESPVVGVPHYFDWTVPDAVDASVWVRVRMDNTGTDYEDVSAAPFSIVAAPNPADVNGDGLVNVNDLVLVITGWGPCLPGPPCDADVNDDHNVNVNDLVLVITNWS
jgi:hypothetical protein